MDIVYSSNDTIEKYTTLFSNFCEVEEKFNDISNDRRLIDFSAGLALTNSIHERFIKCIIEEYSRAKNIELSNTKKDKIIKKYKTPKSINAFINLLHLDVGEGFEFYKNELDGNLITSFENIISVIKEQRDIRNSYLHGDFNFEDMIVYDDFYSNLVLFQKYHVTMFKIIRYSFTSNVDKLPEILDV